MADFECGVTVTVDDVKAADVRIRPLARVTPVLTNDEFDRDYGRQFYFKMESMQRTGAFKIRGVTNKIRKLQENNVDIPGLVTHSSGNHGRALAFVAKETGVPCVIVCPTTSTEAKLAAIRALGAEIKPCEPTLQSRNAIVDQVVKERGYINVTSCEDYDVIAGQGTMGLELLKQVPDLDAILVSVSGGGMAAGICAAVKGIKPNVKVFAVEPEGKELQRCLVAGKRLWTEEGKYLDTVADAIRMQQLGYKPWNILLNLAEKRVFTVPDELTLHGMSYAFHKMKVVVEPAAGTAIGAAMSRDLREMGQDVKNVGVIVCGGNVDPETFFKQLKTV